MASRFSTFWMLSFVVCFLIVKGDFMYSSNLPQLNRAYSMDTKVGNQRETYIVGAAPSKLSPPVAPAPVKISSPSPSPSTPKKTSLLSRLVVGSLIMMQSIYIFYLHQKKPASASVVIDNLEAPKTLIKTIPPKKQIVIDGKVVLKFIKIFLVGVLLTVNYMIIEKIGFNLFVDAITKSYSAAFVSIQTYVQEIISALLVLFGGISSLFLVRKSESEIEVIWKQVILTVPLVFTIGMNKRKLLSTMKTKLSPAGAATALLVAYTPAAYAFYVLSKAGSIPYLIEKALVTYEMLVKSQISFTNDVLSGAISVAKSLSKIEYSYLLNLNILIPIFLVVASF